MSTAVAAISGHFTAHDFLVAKRGMHSMLLGNAVAVREIQLEHDATLKAAVFRDGKRFGPVLVEKYNQLREAELSTRAIVFSIKAKSGRAYRIDLKELHKGGLAHTDREYEFGEYLTPQQVADMIAYLLTPSRDQLP